MLKKMKLLALLVLLSSPALALGGRVVVIVNESNDQVVTEADVKAIYSDRIIQWDNGVNIKSYILPTKNSDTEVFSQKILGMSATEAAKEWANRKITNTAKNPPKTKRERLVILQVKKRPGAIGYVNESTLQDNSGVRVLFAID